MALDPKILAAWQDGFSRPERLSIPEFGEKYISFPASSGAPGRFDKTRSKYLSEVFAALQDPRVRLIIIKAAVQTGKNVLADLFTPWVMVNAAGNILWITRDEDLGKKYAETRLNPILLGCEPVRKMLPRNRHFLRNTSIVFPNHTSLILGGANIGNLQSLSARYLIGDECWLWKQGYIAQFLARARAFPNNSKALLISQAGDEGHDFSEIWETGNQCEWGFTCPQCGLLQPYEFARQRQDSTWAGLRFNGVKENDLYNVVESIKDIWLECFGCGHKIIDNPHTRRALSEAGAYIVKNPNADPAIKSFSWNSLAASNCSFASIVAEFLTAKNVFATSGLFEAQKNFYLKTLAKTWNPYQHEVETKAAIGEYDPNAKWNEAVATFLTVDVQERAPYFWYVIRSWAQNGESRQLACGSADTWEHIRELQEKYAIKDQWVFVDCSNDERTVFQQCVKYGHAGTVGGIQCYLCWNALRGSNSNYFIHRDAKGRETRDYVSPPKRQNPGVGTNTKSERCTEYMFSNQIFSNILDRHYKSKAAKFLVPKDDPAYTAQMNSEHLVKNDKGILVWTRKGKRANHLWDCEKMQMVAASIARLLGDRPKPLDLPEPENKPPDTSTL